MSPELILWLGCAGWAVLLLLAMMRRRQQLLDGLLQGYVQRQAQVIARRQKAARPADMAASNSQLM